MCDYSLMGVPNRIAKEGEELIVHLYPTGTKGLTSPAELRLPKEKVHTTFWEGLKSILRVQKRQVVSAVCIPPGSRLILRDIPLDIQFSMDVRPIEIVTFMQLDVAENRHHDAVRFNNGFEISLQHLSDGQRVTVDSLGFDTAENPSPDNCERVIRL